MGYYYTAAYIQLITYVVFLIGICCVFGFATKKVIENKGYSENWFWWGFFFWLIALIVALAKPEAHSGRTSYDINSPLSRAAEEQRRKQEESNRLRIGGWRCNRCGTVNDKYTGTCSCGMIRAENDDWAANQKKEAEQKTELENAQKLKAYKDLLDSGVITQDEFDKKKSELLDP